MNNTTTSQKIRADLTARLRQAEQESDQPKTIEQSLENGWLISWLKRKLAFYNGWHKVYDQQNAAANVAGRFEREPDEGLL